MIEKIRIFYKPKTNDGIDGFNWAWEESANANIWGWDESFENIKKRAQRLYPDNELIFVHRQ